MGYGNYSHDAHTALAHARASLPKQQVFAQMTCHPLMNPKGLRVRESRDSAEHPASLGIVFALDVTGSMGTIPELLARSELPRFMKILLDCGIADAQVLFAAIGDAESDRAPLQVGQFETTAEQMDRWLTWSFLEGGGGPLGHESYELALYFFAEHTELDCVRERGRRGYLFLTGDENPYPALSRHVIDAVLGDRLDEDIPTRELVAAVHETYHPFFLVPDLARRNACERTWRDLLGDHVVCMESPEDTCFVAAGLVALTERVVRDLDGLANLVAAAGGGRERVGSVVRALTPYAASLERDGAPLPRLEKAPLPTGDGAGSSGWTRRT